MDKVLGIISEYNPFHSGHLYHLEKSKEIVKPDYTVAIMSGNFVQRGDTAIIDKWSRAEMALKNGIDLVIELPLVYSISSAENFAMGAIKILDSLNMDTTISFGSEIGDISILNDIAKVLAQEPPEYLSVLNQNLCLGKSFPKAREHAILNYLNNKKYENVLSESNNILGIEYLKTIQKQKARLRAVTITRNGSKYNSISLEDTYPSATAIRQGIINGENLEESMPSLSYKILQDKISKNEFIPGIATFEQAILYRLRTMNTEEIANLPDVSEGLENKIKKASDTYNTLEDLANTIKSKRYTMTRINRILLYVLLNITKKDIEDSYKAIPYIRVLGINQKGKELLSKISKANKNLSIVTSPKKFLDTNKNNALKNMLEKDIFASNIYTLGYKKNPKANLDLTNKLITM